MWLSKGRDAGAAFQRQRMHPVHPVASFDDVNRCGFRGVEVATGELDVDQDIVAPFVVDKRRRFFQRVRPGDDRRKRFKIDLDPGGEIDPRPTAARRRQRHCDRLTDVAHLAGCKDRPVGRLEARQLGGRAHPADALEIAGVEKPAARLPFTACGPQGCARGHAGCARRQRAAFPAARYRRRTGHGLRETAHPRIRGSRACSMPNSRPMVTFHVAPQRTLRSDRVFYPIPQARFHSCTVPCNVIIVRQ